MSSRSPRAGILSVGTELTEGMIQDAHGRFLSAALREIDIVTERIVCIPDDRILFTRELGVMLEELDVVIVTGGLGSTRDDLTREVVSMLCSRPLVFQPSVWDEIVAKYPHAGPVETIRGQAEIPKDFSPIRNRNGTAPGFFGEVNDTVLAALPGPPTELRPMVEETLIPELRRRYVRQAAGELRGTTFLIAEAALERLLRTCCTGEVEWGTRIEPGRVAFTLRGGDDTVRQEIMSRIRSRAGTQLVREEDQPAEVFAVRALERTGKRLVTAESCTGGSVGALVTSVPGSSRVYWGGFTTYEDEAKRLLLGVTPETIERYGAVSQETAEAMARGALLRSEDGADFAVAITGIAGPEGGSPEKPVGTVWVSLGDRSGRLFSKRFLFRGTRERVRSSSSVAAMLLLESMILENEYLDSVINTEYI